MAVAEKVLYIAHMAGLALILIGWLIAARNPADTRLLAWGGRIELLLGLAIVAVLSAGDELDRGHVWIALKLFIAIAVVICAEIANARARQGAPRPQLIHAAGLLTVVNIAVAFLVH